MKSWAELLLFLSYTASALLIIWFSWHRCQLALWRWLLCLVTPADGLLLLHCLCEVFLRSEMRRQTELIYIHMCVCACVYIYFFFPHDMEPARFWEPGNPAQAAQLDASHLFYQPCCVCQPHILMPILKGRSVLDIVLLVKWLPVLFWEGCYLLQIVHMQFNVLRTNTLAESTHVLFIRSVFYTQKQLFYVNSFALCIRLLQISEIQQA